MQHSVRAAAAWIVLAVVCIALVSSCSSVPLRPCAAEGCTEEGIYLYLSADGEENYYCATHYEELVPDEEKTAPEATQRDSSLCELCDREGTLVFTDADGIEHLYCQEHYELASRTQLEEEGAETARVCEICGAPAVISTRTEEGEEHFYCIEHYGEMLDLLG